jgi:DNA polymerase III delta prime subunit
MACAWLEGLYSPGYRIYIFAGRPGVGKTTAAMHLVAYDLWRRGVADSYRDALKLAGGRLFTGRDLEELFTYLKKHVRNPEVDWLVIDDAAVGFHDFGDPRLWSKFVDIIKTARNAVAKRGVIFTTTALGYLSKRVLHSAHVYYVKRERLRFGTRLEGDGGCEVFETQQSYPYVVLVETVFTLEGNIHYWYWHHVKPVAMWRVAGLIPVSEEFAMPSEVEEKHTGTRSDRVERAIDEALEIIRRKKEGT